MQAGMKCQLCRSTCDFLLELLGSRTSEYVIGTTPNKLFLKCTMDNSNQQNHILGDGKFALNAIEVWLASNNVILN